MYKNGQGMFSRSFILVLIVLFGFYSGYSWYQYFYVETSSAGGLFALFGALVLLFAGAVGGAYISLYRPNTSEFLIDMDGELRKVNWPAVTPLFSPKAEAWGATAVVIITVVVFALFICAVDVVLTYVVQQGFLIRVLGS